MGRMERGSTKKFIKFNLIFSESICLLIIHCLGVQPFLFRSASVHSMHVLLIIV